MEIDIEIHSEVYEILASICDECMNCEFLFYLQTKHKSICESLKSHSHNLNIY